MKKEKKSNVIFKKSSRSSLFLYLLIYIITTIVFIPVKLLLMAIIVKNVSVSQTLDTLFHIIIEIIIAFLSTFIFAKIIDKKFKITDSRENFLHKFLIFIILLSFSNIILNLVNNTNHVYTQIDTMGALDKYIIGTYQHDKTELDNFIKGTPYEGYESYDDLFEISEKLRFEMIYDELVQPLIYDLASMLSIIFFVELLIRKYDIFIGDV